MKAKALAVSAIFALSLVLQPALAQEADEGAGEGTAKVKGLKFGKKSIEIPALEPFEIDVTVEGYKGVDDFFILREANPNVGAGQWEFELGVAYSCFRSGDSRDDAITMTPSIKYGLGDPVFIELGLLPINMGDGTGIGTSGLGGDLGGLGGMFTFGDDNEPDNGNGDLSIKLFWQLMEEQDIWPAIAMWTEARVPTGDGSEKIDGTLNFNFTKTLHDSVRMHFGGYVKTANGAHGDYDREDIGDRRDFQCGAGAGFDFALADTDLLLINYLNKSSEYNGNSSNNVFEAGWVHDFGGHQLMMGVDYADVKGDFEDPRWTGKVQWSISF